MKPETVVYTCIFGDYDSLKDPLVISNNIDYICFTDNSKLKSNIWQTKIIPLKVPFSLSKSAKYPKILPHVFLSNYKYSLYIDGSMTLKRVPDVKGLLKGCVIASSLHPRTVYSEIEACIELNKDSRETLLGQKDFYEILQVLDLPIRTNGIITREHNSPKLIHLEKRWFSNLCVFSSRDQISFPVVFRNFPVGIIGQEEKSSLIDISVHRDHR